MAQSKPLKLAFYSVAGIGGLTAATLGGAYLGNLYVYHQALTVEDFVKEQGLTYSAETMELIRSHDEVRVVEKGSDEEKIYRFINRWQIFGHDGKMDVYFTNPPFFSRNFMGARPLIVSPSLGNTDLKGEIRRISGKETTLSPEFNLIEFSYNVFHELAHDDIRKNIGDLERQMHPVLKELYCDRRAITPLVREFGERAKNLVLASRAIDAFNAERDIFSGLTRDEDSEPEAEIAKVIAEHSQFLPFTSLLRECIETRDPSKISTDGSREIDLAYNCMKSKRLELSGNLRLRAEGFVQGYEFLF